ncbi:protein kinase [Terrisporobacter petrolearius]|uniref:protein kinase domain-containing protein n=1 Tax=Terrisporobacter petrolearius TaxID=1460447 RepID=UPI001D165F92|nr:protein kinase [Terrisporobacter petrolearius]MCC3863099.1 protein kinase [Terrisporobacter petrolearius]
MRDFNYKYTIRDFIDKTKWSNVYSGIKKETNEKIIINILINLEGNEENLESFKKEIELLRNINSENVTSINLMDSYIKKDKIYYYIESEDFEGLTLDELMRINKLHKNQCLQIIREVINGVKEFNNKKINFEDLTRENIIINGQGVIKIDTLSFINNHRGHINCKIHDAKNFRPKEDVQAIGKILCQMITGKEIFNPQENKNLDKDISQILAKATNKKHISKDKYRDLNEFLNDIDLYLCKGELINSEDVNLKDQSKLNPNYNIKKYVIIACSVVVLLCTTAFGAQYVINKNTDNISTKNTSEAVYKVQKSSNDESDLNLTPIEENMIKPKDSTETKKEEKIDVSKKSKENIKENTKKEDKKENTKNKKENTKNKEKNNKDKEKPDKDNSNKDKNKEKPDKDKDKDDKDEDKPDKEKPDDDNSNKEKPNQNPDEDKNLNNNKDVVE